MARDQKLNLDDLACRFSLDKYQLIRHFKRQLGITPNGYPTLLRIEQGRPNAYWHKVTR